jgi:Fe-S cluster biogenesis protein NfuA
MREDNAFLQRVQQIEGLIHHLETIADATVQANMRSLVQSLLELHGAGLEQIIAIVSQADAPGDTIMDRLVRDDLVSSLLLLHGLHPVDLQTRVQRALDKVRTYLDAHGGQVALLSIVDGVVRLRLQGSGHDHTSSAAVLKQAIEEAIYESAPDVTALEVEDLTMPSHPPGFIPLEQLR